MKLILASAAALNILSIVSCLFILRRFYFKGYEKGRKDADTAAWWIEAEQEVNRERQKIWKEEE